MWFSDRRPIRGQMSVEWEERTWERRAAGDAKSNWLTDSNEESVWSPEWSEPVELSARPLMWEDDRPRSRVKRRQKFQITSTSFSCWLTTEGINKTHPRDSLLPASHQVKTDIRKPSLYSEPYRTNNGALRDAFTELQSFWFQTTRN